MLFLASLSCAFTPKGYGNGDESSIHKSDGSRLRRTDGLPLAKERGDLIFDVRRRKGYVLSLASISVSQRSKGEGVILSSISCHLRWCIFFTPLPLCTCTPYPFAFGDTRTPYSKGVTRVQVRTPYLEGV